MSLFLVVFAVTFLICLLLVTTMQPVRSMHSLNELKRRAHTSKKYALELDRYELHAALLTFINILRAILLVIITCSLVLALGWQGFGLALVVAIVHPALARINGIGKLGQALYKKIEPQLLNIVNRFEPFMFGLRAPTVALHEPLRTIDSREDLAELVERSKDVIGPNERSLLSAALSFGNRTVNEVMTPRSVIDSIKKSEFLGPLVLDELHSLGHSRLPVIDGDLDHIIGVLHLRDLLSLDIKRSATAEKAMEPKVFYIREDDTLEHALAAFIKSRHHLFIVINSNRETVGLLSLEDVVEALIGRKIVDEDDIHADLRAVAERAGRLNNNAPGHVDL